MIICPRLAFSSTLPLCFRNILALFSNKTILYHPSSLLFGGDNEKSSLKKRALLGVTCAATCSAFVIVLVADWLLSNFSVNVMFPWVSLSFYVKKAHNLDWNFFSLLSICSCVQSHLKIFFTLMADEKFICDEYVRNTYDKVLITDMFTRCKKKIKE